MTQSSGPPAGRPPLPPQHEPLGSMATKWWLAAIFALIALVVGLAAWTFLRDDLGAAVGDTTTTAGETTLPSESTNPEEGATTTSGADTTSSLAPSTSIAMPTAEDAVLSWIAALADGDLELAWALMDEASREAVGGRNTFEALRTELAEGFGAWDDAADRAVYVTVVEEALRYEIVVVTLVGGIDREGETVQATVAIPAIVSDGYQVLPFLRGDLVEFITPESTAEDGAVAPMAADGVVDVVVPETADYVVLTIDPASFVMQVDGDGLVGAAGGKVQATFALDPPLDPGRYAVTVVYVGTDVVHADAILVDATR